MNSVKKWIVEQFLPAYAREILLEDNERLRRELQDAKAELREVQHYAAGLEYAMRHLPGTTVTNNYEGKT